MHSYPFLPTPKKTRNFLGLGLIPQAGVAIGLAAMGSRIFETNGFNAEATALTTIILASSILYELIGPGSAKLGLYLSHSYGHEDINEVAPISETKQEDSTSSKQVDILVAQINKISKEIKELEPEEKDEEAFNEAAEEYESENYIHNRRGFINRK